MWLIAVTVPMNIIGLLSAAAALILICLDDGSWRNWLSSRRGQGTLSMLAGGCALVMGGQYQLFRLLYDATRLPDGEPYLGPAAATVWVAGAALLALGGWLLYFGRERNLAEQTAPGGVTVARGFALMTAVGTLIVVLAGLNLFQYFTRSNPAVETRRGQPRQIADQQVIDRFHELFYSSRETWPSSKWLGVPTMQNPNDV